MIDYLTAQGIGPRHIYREIIGMISRAPRGFLPLLEADIFTDVHAVAGGTDPDPTAPRSRICRVCASEVLLWGLREWWVQERKKGFLEEEVTRRPDCPEGPTCNRQKNYGHAKEFNHIIALNGEPFPPPQPNAQPNLPPGQIPRDFHAGEPQAGGGPGLTLPPYQRTIIYADFTPDVSPEPEPRYPPVLEQPSRTLAAAADPLLSREYHIPPELDPREGGPSEPSTSSTSYVKRFDDAYLEESQGTQSTSTVRDGLNQVAVAIPPPRHPRHSILDLLQPTDIPVQTTGMMSLPSSQDQVDALL